MLAYRLNIEGLGMRMIDYHIDSDTVDVMFDDGVVIRGVSYQRFLAGEVYYVKEKAKSPLKGKEKAKSSLELLREERLGEVNTNNAGMRMKIIRYGEYGDIDVQFEDGTIVKDKAYDAFKNGSIKNPSKGKESWESRVGEVSVHNSSGMKMKIIRYGGYNDIDVQFEDGTVVKNKTYGNFKNGKIRKGLLDRTGEVGLHSSGAKMTIIRYGSSSDIDVQFEDGVIVKNKEYGCFKNGYIKRPSESRLGEVNTNNDGMQMKIIRYGDANDIDVQFEDGTVAKNKAYASFKSGSIRRPSESSRVGEVGVNNSGLKMTIIRYGGAFDIDVQFEDGTIVRHKAYTSFKKGKIMKSLGNEKDANRARAVDRTGEVRVHSSGMKMKIIRYLNSGDIDVQFEDGTIVMHKQYASFKKGTISKPKKILGEESFNNDGLKMKIVRYENYSDIDVQFEDGTIVRNRTYTDFKNGCIRRN